MLPLSSVTVTWKNGKPGESIDIMFTDVLGVPFSFTGVGPSGSHTFNLLGYMPQSGSVTPSIGPNPITLDGPLIGCS